MWILLGMILLMPFEKNPYLKISSSFLGIIPEFTAIKLLGLIGLAWLLWRILSGKSHIGLFETPQSRMFFVFLGVVVLSGLIGGTGRMALTRYTSLALFLPLMLATINDEEDIRRVLWTCVGVMILVFPYAYRQFLRFGSRFGVGFYEPNYFALALVLLAPLACVIALQQVAFGKRALWFAGAGVLMVSLILTGSRGGFLGFVIGLGVLTFRLARRPLIVTSLVVMGLIAFVLVFPTNLGQRLLASGLDPAVQSRAVTASTQARSDLLQAGLRMIADYPVFGVGLGRFKEMSSVFYDVEKSRIAHNTYLEIAAESGLPALAAFLLFLTLIFRSLIYSTRLALEQDRPHVYEWAMALQAGLAGYVVSACFLSAQFEKFFWLIVFMSIVLERFLVAESNELDWEDPLEGDDDMEEVIEEPAWTRWQLPGSSGAR
jgi:O-Antigen ligase